MGKLITLIIFAVLFFFGYLYLIAGPDDPLRKQIFTAVGLEKAEPEQVKAQSLEEIQALADGMNAEERWEMRGKLFSYLEAIDRGNTAELMTPPLNTETLLKNAPCCVDHLRLVSMNKESVEHILPILDRIHAQWGVSHCEQCSNTLITECTACTKKETKKTPASAAVRKPASAAAGAKESELGANSVADKPGVVSGKEWMNRRMSAGKNISSMKMLGSRELDRSGDSKVKPIKGTSAPVGKARAEKENDDAAAEEETETVQNGVRFCQRCKNTREIVCPACVRRSEERVRYYSSILNAEIKKLLPLFPK